MDNKILKELELNDKKIKNNYHLIKDLINDKYIVWLNITKDNIRLITNKNKLSILKNNFIIKEFEYINKNKFFYKIKNK